MKIVIDIPDRIHYGIEKGITVNGSRASQIVLDAVKNGTPLPKGHGDFIDKEKLKENINGWYTFMKDVCKQPYMTLKQEEIIGKIDMMTPIIEAESEKTE